MEQCLVAAVCALHHLVRYAMYFLFVTIVFQSAKELTAVCGDAIYRKFKVKIIELLSYNVRFESGEGAWKVCKQLETI